MTAADAYAARVDAVLAQRTRLRGPQPPGDLFGGLPPNNPLMASDPHRPLDPNLAIIASYVEPADVIVDVGGGAGRISLPLALRCRKLINVDPSAAMGTGFEASAKQAGIANARFIQGDWLEVAPPEGDLALVTHVTYLTRDIVPFVERLEQAARQRVIMVVGSPPPPSWNRVLYRLVHGEEEVIVPGHAELLPVLWEMDILPDVRILANPPPQPPPAPTREAAVQGALGRFIADQWSLWPLGPELENRARQVLETRFDELFGQQDGGFVPRWITPGREVLITWETRR